MSSQETSIAFYECLEAFDALISQLLWIGVSERHRDREFSDQAIADHAERRDKLKKDVAQQIAKLHPELPALAEELQVKLSAIGEAECSIFDFVSKNRTNPGLLEKHDKSVWEVVHHFQPQLEEYASRAEEFGIQDC